MNIKMNYLCVTTLRLNTKHIRQQHWHVGFRNGSAAGFLRGRNLSHKCYLYELLTSHINYVLTTSWQASFLGTVGEAQEVRLRLSLCSASRYLEVVQLYALLNSILDGVSGQLHVPAALSPVNVFRSPLELHGKLRGHQIWSELLEKRKEKSWHCR
jgi:hypothetical protein